MPPSTTSPTASTSYLAPPSTPPLPLTKPPRPEASRPYRSACALCKRGKTRCTWGAGPASDGCVPCLRKSLSCPGVPAFVGSKPPKTRRAAPLQPVPPSTALVHLGPTSAPARIAATQVVALLAMDLLSSFAEHQNYHPAGITVDDIRRSVLGVHGRLEELRGSIKVVAFAALASGARSSSHPALIGPEMPSSAIAAFCEAEIPDLSRFGALREGPCMELVRKVTDACSSEISSGSRRSLRDLQALLMISYLPIIPDMSFSDPYIAESVALFRRLAAESGQSADERSILFELGQAIVRRDAVHALYSHRSSLLSDVEAQSLVPRFPISDFAFTFDFDYVELLKDSSEVVSDSRHVEDALAHIQNIRVHVVRDLSCTLASAPSNLLEEEQKAARLRQFWLILRQCHAGGVAALKVASSIYKDCLLIGLTTAAERLAQLIITLTTTFLTFSLTQLVPQAVVQRWHEAGSLSPSSTLLEKSTFQTRKVIRAMAASNPEYLLPAHVRVTIQSLHSMRLEACPEWVSIALQRLPDSPDEEVSLDELERLAVGLRVEGWIYGRTVVRLRELEAGIVAIREQQFLDKAASDFAIEDYLDLSSL